MIAVPVSLAAAMFFGIAYVLTQKAMDRDADTYSAVLFSIGITFVCSAVAVVLTSSLDTIVGRHTLPFVAAGLLVPVVSRILLYIGFGRIGVARTAAISGTTPFFSVIAALLFLGERSTLLVAAGIVSTVCGIVVISEPHRETKTWKLSGMSFPLGAAVLFAIRYTLSRFGLFTSNALVGATTTSGTSFTVFAIGGFLVPHRPLTSLSLPALRFLMSAGLAYTAAYWCMFTALATEKLAVVTPLIHTDPLWTLLLSSLFLREKHAITPALVWGTVLAFAGGVLIIVGR